MDYFCHHLFYRLTRKLLKASKNSGSKALLNVLALYDQNTFDTSSDIRARSFIEFIDLLTREFSVERLVLMFCPFIFIYNLKLVSSLPDDITTVIRDLHRNLSSSLLPRVVLSSDRQIQDEDVIQLSGLISGWYRLLCLGGWLGFTSISGVFHKAHTADLSEHFFRQILPFLFVSSAKKLYRD
jgi:hypothetical protein